MNYYIQGSADRAKQIKAAFEKLGCDTTGWKFNVEGELYYTHEGRVYLACSNFLINLIKTHPDYKELELPVEPKFKVGDWIVHADGSSDTPVWVYGLKEDRYLVTNMLGTEYEVMITYQDKWRLWSIADAKDGDVIAFNDSPDANLPLRWIGIYKQPKVVSNRSYWFHCIITPDHTFRGYDSWWVSNAHPATKEQRDLLFAKMKEAGYEWDAEKKELKKNKPHYDISNFHAGMPVLVRADNNCRWDYSIFSRITGNEDWKFAVCNGVNVAQCIPYEGNEALLGTTDPCDEQYINW